ncbi:MAG TPA: protein kinase, partial [Polyangiales bacterium]|nr:protein kinase [Polyangiales bacterium]
MGRVYRAHDTKLLRRVALKVLTSKGDATAMSREVTTDGAALILREARAAAAITHENAVTIFDVGEVDGVPYIAMEYIQGESLRVYVGDPSIAMERRIDWLAAIARALSAAHEGGLVHRDVKPENVLVRDDGFIKVLDFGIAQHRSATVEELAATFPDAVPSPTSLQRDTRISGTPAYMAPEQLRGERSDGRADQFAWGLVAYELLTGRHPCPSLANLTALISELLQRPPIPPRVVNPQIPEHVEQVVLRALSKAADDRYPTMNELLSALTLVDPARVSAPRPSSRVMMALEGARTVSASVVVIPAPSHSRRRLAIALGAAGLVATLIAFAVVRKTHATSSAAAADASGPPTAPTAVTDLPTPSTEKPEARAEYRAGLQSARDGAGSEARVHFARAVEADPMMASAYVWAAALSAFQDRARARASLEKANEQRASLTERDSLFLKAIAPLLDRDPADLAESERLTKEAAAAFPGDAQLRLQLAIIRAARGDEAALGDADAALKLDPKYVAAELIRALTFEAIGQEENALATYQKCVEDNPSSASCFAGELKLLSRKGQCDRVNDEARRWTTSHPSDPEAFRQRALFLSARDGSKDNVVELLSTSRNLLPAGAKHRREQTDQLALLLYSGDLIGAKASAEKLAADATDLAEHGEAALALVEINEELGHDDEAGNVANAFLKRRELWAGAARMEQDPTAFFAAIAQRANLASRADADKTRDEWMARWASRGRGGERWLMAYASGVDTADEAKQALRELPKLGALPTLPEGRWASSLGHVYLLAGDLDDAIPALERAAADCGVLRAPIVHARSLYWLGNAYAQHGDKERACAAYAKVKTS